MKTLEDVAKELGVSSMTVSRALNNTGYVNSETKRKIIKTAQEIGYVPNVLARSLKNKTTSNVGLVISNIKNLYYSGLTYVIQNRLKEHGYNLIIYNTNENLHNEKEALMNVQEQRCRGVIISSVGRNEKYISQLSKYSTHVVMINRPPVSKSINYVAYDNQRGAFIATEHLIQKGHRAIAYLTGPSFNTSCRDKLAGYRKALEQYGLPYDETLIIRIELSQIRGYQATLKLIDSGVSFSAIFCFSDWIAIGALKALLENGIRVPEDVALVGYDNIDISAILRVPLTTVDIPAKTVGKKAVACLLEQIEQGNHHPQAPSHIVLEPGLVVRQSTESQSAPC